MSNTITVQQDKLVLNTFAAHLQNNLIAGDLVTWRKNQGEFNDRNALTIVEQVPPRYVVTRTSSGVNDLTATGTQDTVFGSEQFSISEVFGSSMGWGDFQKIRDIDSARENEAVKAAALQMAEQIDAYILRTLVLATNNWTGTPGAAVATFDDVATAHTRLKEEGVDDADLRAVLLYQDRQALADWIVDNNDSALSSADGIYRQGFSGTVAGIPTLFTQQIPTLQVGTRAATGASLINGAAQNVNYRAVARSPAPGQYMTQTINIDGLTAGQTIRDGEVFTIANVFAYDNRLQAPLTYLSQFRVIGDYTAAVGGVVNNMRIFPAIIVPGSGTGKDVGVNTAHATVNAAPADNAAITWLGAAGALIRPRVLAKKDAIVCHTMDLVTPATGTASRMSLKKLPISVRMWKDSNFNTGQHNVRFDTVINANINRRVHACRMNGA